MYINKILRSLEIKIGGQEKKRALAIVRLTLPKMCFRNISSEDS